MPGWRLSNSEAMGVDKQCLQSFAIVALGVKEKVTSGSDILSFAYSGVESLRTPPLPRKSFRLQTRRVCCSSLWLKSWAPDEFRGYAQGGSRATLHHGSCRAIWCCKPSRVRKEGKTEEVVKSGEIKLTALTAKLTGASIQASAPHSNLCNYLLLQNDSSTMSYNI